MSPILQLRLRTPTGVVPLQLPADATFEHLRSAAAAATAIRPDHILIHAGYPPRPLNLTDTQPVRHILRSGEVLAVSSSSSSSSSSTPSSSSNDNNNNLLTQHTHLPSTNPSSSTASAAADLPTPSQPAHHRQHTPDHRQESISEMGTIVERVVPDDNSCLFRSVAAIVYNDPYADTHQLRLICSRAIAQDPLFYSEQLLQKPNPAYCHWIERPTSWGGPIELAILSEYFKVELAAYDIRSMRPERYNQGQYPTVGFLIYDGLHYNYLCLNIAPDVPDITQFDANDTVVVNKVFAIVQNRNKAGAFTDTYNFMLQCLQCNKLVVGDKGAEEHGKETGHQDFQEVKRQH